MRPGLFLSLIFHAAIFGSAYVVFPMATTTMSEELIIVPIELVTVSDTTNLTAPQPDPVEEPEPEPTPEPEEEAPPEEEPIPEEDAEVSDEPDPFAEEDGQTESEPEEVEPEPEETAEPEPEPEVTPEPKPTPTPTPKVIPPKEEKKEQTNSFLNSVLQTTEDKKKTREREYKAAPDLKKVENANQNKRSAGDRSRDTATWTTMLKSKIETKCFRDPSDMANAERLQVTYKITFNKDGSLMRSPRRISPTIIPGNDQQMRIFDINATRAIEKCAPYNDILPAEYYDEWKDFTFVFGVR
ncbi:TonB domain-containing protein [Hirschia baltica ATCC 49814]|uniref:TonB domain-containing protein n=2 Tax=Hirschia TaxID=2723 RepID=C6XND1_HIRBI|nr:TonB domain-containing protein [Hirschia baltica ATCC 49814]